MRTTRPEDYTAAPSPGYSDGLTKREYFALILASQRLGEAKDVTDVLYLADLLMDGLNTYPPGTLSPALAHAPESAKPVSTPTYQKGK